MGEKAKKGWVAVDKSGMNAIGWCVSLNIPLSWHQLHYPLVLFLLNLSTAFPFKYHRPHDTDEKNGGKGGYGAYLAEHLDTEGAGPGCVCLPHFYSFHQAFLFPVFKRQCSQWAVHREDHQKLLCTALHTRYVSMQIYKGRVIFNCLLMGPAIDHPGII